MGATQKSCCPLRNAICSRCDSFSDSLLAARCNWFRSRIPHPRHPGASPPPPPRLHLPPHCHVPLQHHAWPATPPCPSPSSASPPLRKDDRWLPPSEQVLHAHDGDERERRMDEDCFAEFWLQHGGDASVAYEERTAGCAAEIQAIDGITTLLVCFLIPLLLRFVELANPSPSSPSALPSPSPPPSPLPPPPQPQRQVHITLLPLRDDEFHHQKQIRYQRNQRKGLKPR